MIFLAKKPLASVIIVFDKLRPSLFSLLDSIKCQKADFAFEIVLVSEVRLDPSCKKRLKDCRIIEVPAGKGIPFNRNQGIKHARGRIIAFVDDDCLAEKGWLSGIVAQFSNPEVLAVMGRVIVPKSGFFGDSVSALGFPAGGSIGFEKIWHVSPEGFTNHLSTCNCAVRKSVLDGIGGFDESLMLGTEDAELSSRLEKKGVLVKFAPKAIVSHGARDSLRSFAGWQLRRGRANFHFRKKVGKVSGFVMLRFWSSKNIVQTYLFDPKIFLIIPLLVLSFLLQQTGFMLEKAAQFRQAR